MINQEFGLRPSIKTNSAYYLAVSELLVASVIWGTSFTLVRWALEDFSTVGIIFWRFLLAFFIGEILFLIFIKKRQKDSASDRGLALKAGIFLAASLTLQTHGLNFTSATNSSFITSIYVVLIPIISGFMFKHQVTKSHFLLGLLAFIGMGFLLGLSPSTGLKLNVGDILTLICAVTSAFHIIYVGQAATSLKSAFRFNTYQSFWTFLLALPLVAFELISIQMGYIAGPQKIFPTEFHLKSVLSLLGLAVLVSGVAFYLQVRAQRVLNNMTSSLLCLLEAPNAFLFAAIFLNERLNSYQIFGVVLILLSSFFSIYVDRPKHRSH